MKRKLNTFSLKNLFPIFLSLFFLTSCVPPPYQEVTYGIEEFASDSQKINQGKMGILELEGDDSLNDEESLCAEEKIIDGDGLSFLLISPKKTAHWDSLQSLQERISYRVRDGCVNFPLIGSLCLEGLTLKEARETLKEAYKEELPNCTLYLDFSDKKMRKVQIIGGALPFVPIGPTTSLSEVLALAKVDSTTNLFQSYIERQGEKLRVDFYRLIHQGDQTQNIRMRDGDTLFLASLKDAAIVITGEVAAPLLLPLPYGFITLPEAIVCAKGALFTTDKAHIYVIRGKMMRPKIYCLGWEEIILQKDENLLLMPGDILYLTEKPITQWNRFISQLVPTFSCLQFGLPFKQMFYP